MNTVLLIPHCVTLAALTLTASNYCNKITYLVEYSKQRGGIIIIIDLALQRNVTSKNNNKQMLANLGRTQSNNTTTQPRQLS